MSDHDRSVTESQLADSIRVEVQGDELPEGISRSEHRAILESVNSILTDRARPPAELSVPTRRRSGAGMVAAVNIATILIVAGAVFGYIRFAPRAAPDVNLFSGSVATTEAAILEEAQERSERALSEREQEIARIERELAELRRARESGTETGTSERERELEAALERLDASASERLSALEATESRLTFLTEQLTSIYGRIQNSIREQEYETARELVLDAEALIESSSIANEPALATLSRSVAAANRVLAEVIPLAADESGRLALLASQVEEIELTVAQADARAEAGELEQAETLYRSALRVLDGTDRAASQLLELEASRSRETMREQEETFRGQIAGLRRQLEQSQSTVRDLRSQVAALETRRDALERSREELEANTREMATRMTELETDERRASERVDELSAALERANATAASRRQEIGGLEGEIAGLEEDLASAERRYERVAEEAAKDVAALNQTVSTLRGTVESMRESADETARTVGTAAGDLERQLLADQTQTEGPEVIDLLGTRVLLRAVVDSPSVREEYPSLDEEMETYFQALGRARTQEGREAAYREASGIVEELARRLRIDLQTEAPPDSAQGYLERVVALVQGALATVAR